MQSYTATPMELRSYLKETVVDLVQISENMAVGIRHTDRVAPSIRKSWH
jgi:hypothetical protein